MSAIHGNIAGNNFRQVLSVLLSHYSEGVQLIQKSFFKSGNMNVVWPNEVCIVDVSAWVLISG
jgi:hypothetical protein